MMCAVSPNMIPYMKEQEISDSGKKRKHLHYSNKKAVTTLSIEWTKKVYIKNQQSKMFEGKGNQNNIGKV